jgi:hypothetical protein
VAGAAAMPANRTQQLSCRCRETWLPARLLCSLLIRESSSSHLRNRQAVLE